MTPFSLPAFVALTTRLPPLCLARAGCVTCSDALPRVAAVAAATTPGSRPRSPFEPKIAAILPRGGGGGGSPSRTPPHVETRAAAGRAENSRKNLRAFAVLLVVAVLLCVTALLTALAGLWKWVDVFPYRSATFNASKNCRAVHTGPEEPCSNILESTCFDRSRCLGGNARAAENSLSVYVLSLIHI